MRSLLKIVSAVGLAMALATSAQAVLTPFTGQISYGLSTLPPIIATGAGSGNTPGVVTINTAAWAATTTLLTLDPTAAPPLSALAVQLTAPGPCAALPGSCPLGGTVNALVAGTPFLVVPNSPIGQSTKFSFGPYGSYLQAQAWQTGVVPVTVGGVTLTETPGGTPIVTTGYDNRTPGGQGTIKLVAPAGLASGLAGNLPLFVSMTLQFGPEPAAPLLLVSGVVAAVILGRRRMRR
jgi:hypothetical protein